MTHIQSLDELPAAAAGELGPLLSRLTSALIAVTGCVKTYVLLVSEKPGFEHLHFHIVPRAAGLPTELQGPGVFALLGVSTDEQVPLAEQDRVSEALSRAVA
jgi:diadenosine tetraphosphate (Ap4A) HIT family hydrolase